MTAPLYLRDAPLDAVTEGALLVLDGDEGRHAGTVRRTRPGERLDLADGLGRVARCEVVSVAAGRLELRVVGVVAVPAPVPRLVLVQALAKAGRDELAVETATELGVDAVLAWQAARSVVVWSGERGERARRKWQGVARAAAKQSRRPTVPEVGAVVSTRELAGLVTRTVAEGGRGLVLHEDAGCALADVPLVVPGPPADSDRPAGSDLPTGSNLLVVPDLLAGSDLLLVPELLLVVGPEGGIGQDELAVLTTAGAVAVRLGPNVLRTSSAGAAALAVLNVRLGRWS